MNKRSLILITVLISFLMTGCNHDRFTLRGIIKGVPKNRYLLLEEVKPGILEPVDSLIPGIDGSFRFKSDTPVPAFYLLSFGHDNYMTLLIEPGENIRITAKGDSLSRPLSVEGSEGTAILLGFREKHSLLLKELGDLDEVLNKALEDSAMSRSKPLITDSLDRIAVSKVSDFQGWAADYLNKNIGSMASLYLLNQQVVPRMPLFDPGKEPDVFFRVDSSLYEQYPESDIVLDLHNYVAMLRNSVNNLNGTGTETLTGEIIRDISLPDPSGDTIKLSSLRGKIVLVDFWAAWCPPCREENPNLVRLYDLYHYKGFEIYQVSLDMVKEEWTAAIRNDRLGRWTHVSDLRYRDSEVVKEFGITGIPFNILIDKDGTILDYNLRGADLQKTLEELFTKH